MMRFFFALFLALLLTVATTQGSAIVSRHADRNRIQYLHNILHIGNNPNEDIRTNILLNMEGL